MKKILIFGLISLLVSCTGQIYDPLFLKKNIDDAKTVTVISIEHPDFELDKGEQVTLTGKVKLANGKDNTNIRWYSSNLSVAKINNRGVISTFRDGTTEIMAVSGIDTSKSAKITLKVNNPNKPLETDKYKNNLNPDGKPAINSSGQSLSEIELKTAPARGRIFDLSWNPVNDATVSANIATNGKIVIYSGKTSNDGSYLIEKLPVGVNVELTVGKAGWTTKSRTVILKPNSNSKTINTFNFGGSNVDENQFSIQDQPEISGLIINSQKVTEPGSLRRLPDFNLPPENTEPPALEIIDSSLLEAKITFSENINKESVENSLQLISQKFNGSDKYAVFDKNSGNAGFNWVDASHLIFKVNTPLLADNFSDRAVYRLQFILPFRDQANKAAIKDRYIDFTSNSFADYIIILVKKKTEK